MRISLSDLVAKVYWKVWTAAKSNKFTHFWLKGGRSSAKSSFISLAIVLLLILDPDANAICFRKVGDTIRNSVYEQIKWAIEMLGLSEYFRYLVAPLEIVYIPTGQRIMFRGVDDPQKIKSLKLAKGYFKLAWFEELAEFAGMEEVNNVLLSVMRGGGNKPFCYFYSYNPPAQASNWVNAEANRPKDDRLVLSTSYLDVPKEWLGEAFLREAEYQKKSNELLYRHIYLGEATGTGGAIFPNASALKMSDEQISQFDNLRHGIDWGFVNDPFVFVRLHYDRKHRDIYLFDEIYGVGMSNRVAIEKVSQLADPYTLIYADSAEPKSIKEFKDSALYVKPADKGPGSVEFGIKFLQGLSHIYIDPDRCPNAWREFSLYELEKDRYGDWKHEPPDKNNHCLAAGTFITLKDGRKKIERVKKGDLVLTRAGYRKVLWSGISASNAMVYEIKTASGKKLRATANHLIYTDRGFIPVSELKAGDELLEVATCQKAYECMGELGADTQKAKEEMTESISKAAASICTILCGNCSTGKEKREKLSTILTETAKTTISAIWKKSRQKSIWLLNTLFRTSAKKNKESFCRLSAKKQANGTKAKKAANGTENTPKNSILGNCNMLAGFVNFAEKVLTLKTLNRSFAATNANPHTGEKKGLMTSNLYATAAAKALWRTNTQKGNFAVGRVLDIKAVRKEPYVFDLTIEQQHEFFANGILVHNCIDATRYALCKDTLTW